MKKLILEKVVNTIKNEVKYIQYKWAHKICELTNKYICPHCDKVLQKSYRLKGHIKRVHEKLPCVHCGELTGKVENCPLLNFVPLKSSKIVPS